MSLRGDVRQRRQRTVAHRRATAAASAAMTLGVLLVDDEPLIRSGLRAIINAEPDLAVLGEAEDGASVTSLARRLRPDSC